MDAVCPQYPELVAMPPVPDDPNDWTDEEWLAWLEAGDAAERAGRSDEQDRPALPSWRKGPLAFQFLAASMTAIGEVIYGKKEQPAIVIEASGDPGEDDDLDVRLDFERPEDSIAIVRRSRLEQANGEVDERDN